MKSYYSFLICGHSDKTDVYINGRPLGVYKDGVFAPDMLTIKDFPSLFPFADMESFKQEITKIVDAIYFKQNEDKPNFAEELRQRCNNLSKEERDDLWVRGMKIINGGIMD